MLRSFSRLAPNVVTHAVGGLKRQSRGLVSVPGDKEKINIQEEMPLEDLKLQLDYEERELTGILVKILKPESLEGAVEVIRKSNEEIIENYKKMQEQGHAANINRNEGRER